MFVGAPCVGYLALVGTPPRTLGVEFDNTLGRAVLVAIAALLLVVGAQLLARVIRRAPDLVLDGEGASIFRWPRTLRIRWSEVRSIEPPEEVSLGFGGSWYRMHIETSTGPFVMRFKYGEVSGTSVFDAMVARWRDSSARDTPSA
jgi:hypothetical protein